MKESTLHRLSLSLPLLVPLLFTPLVFLDVRLPDWLKTLVGFVFASGMVGGVPYLVLVALLFLWGRGKSAAQFKRALFLSPVLMLPVFVAFLFIFSLSVGSYGDNWEPVEELEMIVLYSVFILGFGYFYVLLVLGTIFVLKRLGVIEPAPAI